MSLLMQALRRAESAKKGADGSTAAPADGAASAPAPAPPPAAPPPRAPAPEGELTLESKEPTADELAYAKSQAEEAEQAAQAAHFSADANGDPSMLTMAPEPEPAMAPAPAVPPAPAAPPPAPEKVDYFSSETPPPRPVYVAPPAPPAVPVAPAPPPLPPPPVPSAPDPKLGAAQQAAARNAASTVFAAKEKVRNRRPLIIAAVGVIALAACGGYGYYMLSHVAPSSVIGSAPPMAVLVPAAGMPAVAPAAPVATVVPVPGVPAPTDPGAPVATVAPGSGSAPAAVPAAAVATLPVTAPASAAIATPVKTAVPLSVTPVDPRFAPAARRQAPLRRPVAAEAGDSSEPGTRSESAVPRSRSPSNLIAATAEPIEVRRTDAARPVSPLLSGAYQSFVSGDVPAARSQYQRMLQQEPDNRDALLGMAAIALNRGQQAEAGSFYARLIELDPTDSEAQAGMASVQRGDPAQTESRLKGVLAASPENGPALFALGNVYAQQARWPEAQQAYFRALGSEPNNAGYAFNLAVSLDKLSQPKLALDYYRRTLQLVGSGGASVNLRAVRERIGQLERAR